MKIIKIFRVPTVHHFFLKASAWSIPVFIILITFTHFIRISLLSSCSLCSYDLETRDTTQINTRDRSLCPYGTYERFITLKESSLALWNNMACTFAISCQFELNSILVIVWWVFFFKNHCLIRVTRFSLDRCVGIKVNVNFLTEDLFWP